MNLVNLATLINALFACISVGAAWVTSRRTRTVNHMKSLIQVAEWFRRDDVVAARRHIYELDRKTYKTWDEKDRAHIAIWVAYLDIVATLVLTGNVARRDLIRLYGDTIFRTVYVLAPFVLDQYAVYGSQYLKSTQHILPQLVREWDRISRDAKVFRRRWRPYPRELKINWRDDTKITPETFRADSGVRQFLD